MTIESLSGVMPWLEGLTPVPGTGAVTGDVAGREDVSAEGEEEIGLLTVATGHHRCLAPMVALSDTARAGFTAHAATSFRTRP